MKIMQVHVVLFVLLFEYATICPPKHLFLTIFYT